MDPPFFRLVVGALPTERFARSEDALVDWGAQKHVQSLFGIGCSQHGEPSALEHSARDTPQDGVVLDEQESL